MGGEKSNVHYYFRIIRYPLHNSSFTKRLLHETPRRGNACMKTLDPGIHARPSVHWAKSVVFAQCSATCGGGAHPCAWALARGRHKVVSCFGVDRSTWN